MLVAYLRQHSSYYQTLFGLNCPFPNSEVGKVCRIRLGYYVVRCTMGLGTGSRLRIRFLLPFVVSNLYIFSLGARDKVVVVRRGLRRVSPGLRLRLFCCNQSSLIDISISLSLCLAIYLPLSWFIRLCLRICFAVALNYWRNLNTPNRKKSKCEPFMQGPHKWRNPDYRNRQQYQQKQLITAKKKKEKKRCRTSDTDTISISHREYVYSQIARVATSSA